MRKPSVRFAFVSLFLIAAVSSAAFSGSAHGQANHDPWEEIRIAQTGPHVIRAPRDIAPAPRVEHRNPQGRVGQPDFAPERPHAHQQPGALGGGFIEFLFTGRSHPHAHPHAQRQEALPRPSHTRPHRQMRPVYETHRPREPYGQFDLRDPREYDRHTPHPTRPLHQARLAPSDTRAYQTPQRSMDPRFEPQIVTYHGDEKPGTIVIDTNEKFLYLVKDDGTAMRYGVGVGREGFGWTGTEKISAKREWPDWYPPESMRKRQPELPVHMPGGPDNPLGARAIYLGDTLYRIHGSNEPWTIGQEVSSGCFRMRNEDVVDLYERVRIGATVKVI